MNARSDRIFYPSGSPEWYGTRAYAFRDNSRLAESTRIPCDTKPHTYGSHSPHLGLGDRRLSTLLFAVESKLLAISLFGILLYGAVTDIQKARRGTDVTFTITERDIISDGYTQNEYYPLNRWRIQAPDLSWKESHSTTEDSPRLRKVCIAEAIAYSHLSRCNRATA